jgi:hypothetical protein
MLVFVKNPLILFVQKVSDFFHHGDGIGFFLRVLSELDKFAKKFLVVGHVKVAGHDQVSASPVVLFEKRMAGFDAVFPMCPVSEVSEPDFTGKGDIFFQPIGVAEGIVASEFFGLFVLLGDFVKDIIDRGSIYRPIPADVSGSGLGVDFDIRHPCPILTSVDLLLHQDIKSVCCK